MNVLITGAAGNLGSFLTRHLLIGPHQLKLMIHHQELPPEIADHPNTVVHQADLGRVETLHAPCEGTDCIVHFAGRLFAPRPEQFLPETNVSYVRNLVTAALAGQVEKFILISFPHVEGRAPRRNLREERCKAHPSRFTPERDWKRSGIFMPSVSLGEWFRCLYAPG